MSDFVTVEDTETYGTADIGFVIEDPRRSRGVPTLMLRGPAVGHYGGYTLIELTYLPRYPDQT